MPYVAPLLIPVVFVLVVALRSRPFQRIADSQKVRLQGGLWELYRCPDFGGRRGMVLLCAVGLAMKRLTDPRRLRSIRYVGRELPGRKIDGRR
jgi:hypothetical protein